jgi:spoIIIJ-associated protein
MNPFERRLIHLTLQNDSKVTTKSEGQGIYRKVKIMPIEKGR